jgi:hypothetical protein
MHGARLKTAVPAVAAWALLALPAAAASAPPLDTIVERYVAARGGRRALEAITSLTFTADMGNGRVRRLIKMRPYYLLVGCTEPDCAIAEGFDGSAWEMYPRKKRVIRARLEAAKSLRRVAEFDEPLIGWREKGHTAGFRGIEDFQGRKAYRIDMVLNDGLPMSCYIDTRTYAMLGNRRPVPVHARGEHVDTINLFEDYRPVAGLLYPFRIRTLDAATGKLIDGARGWDRIEANVPYDRQLFSPPPVSPEPITALTGYLLSITGSVSPAEQWFRPYTAFRANPANAPVDSADDLNWLGYELLKQNAFHEAVLVFRTIAAEHPKSAAAQESLGDALYQADRKADALDAFRKASELDPVSNSAGSKLEELEKTGRIAPRY